MEPKNPDYRRLVYEGFARTPFVGELGIKFADCGPGWCESELSVEPRHLQHGGVVHPGVQATLAEQTAAAAASTLLDVDQFVVTIEFKVTLIRPAVGEVLLCRADVMRSTRSLAFVEAKVHSRREDREHLVSSLSATMAVESR